jgi:hypothetical protein
MELMCGITVHSLFFLKNHHSRNIVGQDQEFWMTDTEKQHFEEQ